MFNLTQDERKVILFLIVMALIGIGANFFIKRYSHIKALAFFSQDIGKVDLNKADKELLMSVSGIGPKLAQRIIDYRKQNFGFKDKEELRNIKGISESKYTQIKDAFIVN